MDHWIVFATILAALVFFVGGWWRYDVVALVTLVLLVILGLVPPADAFAGFGHPAVITVAAILVISHGLLRAGVVDAIALRLERVGDRVMLQVTALTGVVALLSAFMNNVGALALLLPVAVRMARQSNTSPSLLLMPLAFGSLLGGMITMVGTPPNIIIAAARTETAGAPFGLFDFAPVGLGVAAAGIACIVVAWRLIPHRDAPRSRDELFHIDDYLTEIALPEDSALAGVSLGQFLEDAEGQINVVGVVRNETRRPAPSLYDVLRGGDILLVSATSDDLDALLADTDAELVGSEQLELAAGDLEDEDIGVLEAIVGPGSTLVGRTPQALKLRQRHRMNIIGVARKGRSLTQRIGEVAFEVGDILLVQGPTARTLDALGDLGCLPLAERELRIGQPRRIALATGIFVLAIVATVLDFVPVEIAFVAAAVAMVLTRLIPVDDTYKAIDWPVIILLAAMLPVGGALESSGGADLLADALLVIAQDAAPAVAVGTLLLVAMLLSNVINNAAAVVLMIPIATGAAAGLDVSADPLLMAVAVGASAPFLTPIGHQSSALVMSPGGYRFGDYWRLGLPLSLVVLLVAVPLIMLVWPL